MFLLIVISGLLAPVLSPYNPLTPDTPHRLQGISAVHLLGTDDFGRDILARLLYGSRTVLLVAFGAVVFAVGAGSILGTLAGYRRGWFELWTMRSIDVVLSFPLVLVAIIIVVVLGPGVLNLMLAIGISQIPLFARLAHSLALSVSTREFVQAATCMGASDSRILRVHVLPNVFSPIVVQATTTVALAILNASALNFLGLGIQPPAPDWGAMVSDFRRFVFDRPILPLYPGAAIALLVLSLNLLGDGLISLIDPAARRRFT